MNLLRSVATSGALLLGASAMAACGGDASGVEVSGTWSRTSPAMSSAGVIYFDLSSTEGDTLLGATIDSSIAAKAELHETVMAEIGDDESMEDMDHEDMEDMEDMDHEEHMAEMENEGMAGGAMSMVAVDSVAIPKGETVSFMPGGLHVMLIDLVDPLEDGQEFEVTLNFETGGEQVIKVKVQDSAP